MHNIIHLNKELIRYLFVTLEKGQAKTRQENTGQYFKLFLFTS